METAKKCVFSAITIGESAASHKEIIENYLLRPTKMHRFKTTVLCPL